VIRAKEKATVFFDGFQPQIMQIPLIQSVEICETCG